MTTVHVLYKWHSGLQPSGLWEIKVSSFILYDKGIHLICFIWDIIFSIQWKCDCETHVLYFRMIVETCLGLRRYMSSVYNAVRLSWRNLSTTDYTIYTIPAHWSVCLRWFIAAVLNLRCWICSFLFQIHKAKLSVTPPFMNIFYPISELSRLYNFNEWLKLIPVISFRKRKYKSCTLLEVVTLINIFLKLNVPRMNDISLRWY